MRKLLVLWFSIPLLLSQAAFAQADYDFIQTSGEAEVKIKPEFVLLNATVYSRADSASQAQKLNAKEMARVEKILRQDFKIDSKDLQTQRFQVSPQYEYLRDKQVYKGMSVTNSLTIKFRRLDEIGSLLDRLTAGQTKEGFGVRIDELTFGTDQFRTHQTQALEQAVADAKARALVLAKASGKSIVGIRKVSDSQMKAPGFEPVRSLSAKAAFAADAESSTSIAPGELTVRANVFVEFEMK